MSHLPENLNEWPSDPYELLNVDKSTDKKTLKRIYTKLIRIYNPNHSPEHFRKIREAYDEILEEQKVAAYFAQISEEIPENTEEVKPVSEEKETWYSQSLDIWQEAIAGNVEEALLKFQEAHNRDPDPDTTLKLYWLMKLTKRSTSELIQCLEKSIQLSADSRVLQTYFRELENEESRALEDDYLIFILNVAGNDIALFRQLVLKRWEGFYKNKKFALIRKDVEDVREHFSLASEDQWALLLLFVHKFISFADGEEVVSMLKKYHAELESIPVSSGGEFDAAMDHYEYLRAVRKVVRKVEIDELPKEWKEIISDFWVGNENLYRENLRSIMIDWSLNPLDALSSLDNVPYNMRSVIFTQIKRIVYTFSLSQGPYIFISDVKTVGEKCRYFLQGKEGLRYPLQRENLLKFCLNEDVAPDTLYDYIVENQLIEYRWAAEVIEDLHQAVFMCYKSLMSYLTDDEIEEISTSQAS